MNNNSFELKKGEIKQILIQIANEFIPDFDFLAYKNSCYNFQRLRQANGLVVYETLHIIFTLRDRYFACSVASQLNSQYIFVNSYNTGLINPHIDLKVLRYNSGALNFHDAYYFHNGQVETTTKKVIEIFQDYKKFALPYLDKQLERFKSNEIIKAGLDFINNLTMDKQTLKKEIEQELSKGGLLLSSIKHPIYFDLKERLKNVSGQSKDEIQKIPKTAHELLEIYWTR